MAVRLTVRLVCYSDIKADERAPANVSPSHPSALRSVRISRIGVCDAPHQRNHNTGSAPRWAELVFNKPFALRVLVERLRNACT